MKKEGRFPIFLLRIRYNIGFFIIVYIQLHGTVSTEESLQIRVRYECYECLFRHNFDNNVNFIKYQRIRDNIAFFIIVYIQLHGTVSTEESLQIRVRYECYECLFRHNFDNNVNFIKYQRIRDNIAFFIIVYIYTDLTKGAL